jgi:hypothetical protein
MGCLGILGRVQTLSEKVGCISNFTLLWFPWTRKGDARSIAAARSGVQGLSNEEGGEVTEAQSGDVVEYPLSVVVKSQHQDGRNKG